MGVKRLGGDERAALGAEGDQVIFDRGRAGEGLTCYQKGVQWGAAAVIRRGEHGGNQLGRTRLLADGCALQRCGKGAGHRFEIAEHQRPQPRPQDGVLGVEDVRGRGDLGFGQRAQSVYWRGRDAYAATGQPVAQAG